MESADSTPTPENTKPGRKWGRWVLYAFASIGVLAIVLIILAFIYGPPASQPLSVDDSETIESVMSRTYGKYSEKHRGWLYVDAEDRAYVMRIVQQARPTSDSANDDLYFMASGTPLDGRPGAVYGVFQIRKETKNKEQTLVEISSPYRYEGDVPPSPEKVRLEKLGPNVWGWIIKVQNGTNPKEGFVRVNNTVLAPHGDDIAELATFPESFDYDPGIDCAEANRRYQAWLNPPPKPAQTSTEVLPHGELTADAPKNTEPDEEEETEEPARCSKAHWTYRLDTVNGNTFTPIYITGKGVKHGTPIEEKTYKVMFDKKSFVYILPKELEVSEDY